MADDRIYLNQTVELDSVSRNPPGQHAILSHDEQKLAHFGKRQRFRRNFSLISIIGLGCTLMVSWEGVLTLLQPFLINGGPTGVFAAFPYVIFGVLMQVLVMAEMASMIPLSGGQYNWVAILAPPAWSNFLSYMTGWVTTIAWQAACIGTSFLVSTSIQALVELNYPNYTPQVWHATLIFYGLIGLSVFVTSFGARVFPKFEALVLTLHVAGFFGILITLLYLAPKNSASTVFRNFRNGGEFETDAQSWLVGTVSVMFLFIGIDGATHMAEEIENAAVVIPRSLLVALGLNGCLGLGMLTAVLFCMGDVSDVLESKFSLPYIEIFNNVTSSTSIVLIVEVSSAIGLVATSSRMLWAFAREDGVPGSRYISHVDTRTALPLWAIATTAIINLLMALIPLGSTTAFNAFTGLTVAGFYSSFLISASVMLHKRLTTPESDILWGPFRLGKAGVPITLVALAYSIVGMLFSFWPPTATVTAATWNWSFVVYWATVLVALIWWWLRAKYYYTGPKMELSELQLAEFKGQA